ncbi:MAG: GNAT family protein [Solirubrobacteraceae bacterium]
MPALPFLTEPLADERVVMRDGAERDIPEVLIAHQDDPEMHVLLGEERTPSGAELGRRAESEPAARRAGTGATLTILEPGSDVCRGQIYVHHLDWDHARAELGVWVAPQARRRELARRALALVARWLMCECGIERVALVTATHNRPMRHAGRGAGFREEGVLRAHLRERGRRVDAAVLSLVRADLEDRCSTGG